MPMFAGDKLQHRRPRATRSAMQTGFRSRWKPAPSQCVVGGFGRVSRSDTTEQQPCFIMIEKLISTLWW